MTSCGMPIESLGEALRAAYPELASVGGAATEPVYVVGGAVRDLLLGRDPADADLVVEGDVGALAAGLGVPLQSSHERFGTAKIELGGRELDVAATRAETYAHPGALPAVELGASIEVDLGRRDFTVNAMAVPLGAEPGLIDPHGGRGDLDRGLIRVLHPGSFVDDPTRAIRAARYAARLGFAIEPETEGLLRATDLGTVSADRRRAELLRLAAEPSAPRGFELLADWGLLGLRPGGVDLARTVGEMLGADPWKGTADHAAAVLAAASTAPGREVELAAAEPQRPSEAVAAARTYSPTELVLARALGASWLDDYLERWTGVELSIDGEDLEAAGVPRGPAVGAGLAAALRGKLDGEIEGRDGELAAALAAAREA